mgnify:CR=1 FL=1
MLGMGGASTEVTLKRAYAPKSRQKALSRGFGAKKVSEGNPALLALSEKAFQRYVRGVLETLGFVVWVVPNMKQTRAGVPDLTFWHPNLPGRLFCWELKSSTGRLRPAQRDALAHLATVPGMDARIVRPSDWPALRDALLDGRRG